MKKQMIPETTRRADLEAAMRKAEKAETHAPYLHRAADAAERLHRRNASPEEEAREAQAGGFDLPLIRRFREATKRREASRHLTRFNPPPHKRG